MSKRSKQSKPRAEKATASGQAIAAHVDNEIGTRGEAASPLARTYLPESIAVLVLCLTPVAIPAIYYGLAARRASSENNEAGAQSASEMARIWFIFSICFGVVANIAILGAYLISQKS
jgi:hypothetical protein